MKYCTLFAAIIFALIASMHLLRLIMGWEVTVNGSVLPMWPSIVSVIIAGGLAVRLGWGACCKKDCKTVPPAA